MLLGLFGDGAGAVGPCEVFCNSNTKELRSSCQEAVDPVIERGVQAAVPSVG